MALQAYTDFIDYVDTRRRGTVADRNEIKWTEQ